jgi:hypothetical protein
VRYCSVFLISSRASQNLLVLFSKTAVGNSFDLLKDMPKDKARRGGSSHEHTDKADRMAEHIGESEKKRGVSERRAEEIAWRTVHKDLPHEEGEGKES